MRNIIFRFFLATGIAFTGLSLLTGCDKDDDNSSTPSANETYFMTNVTGRDLAVHLATDDGSDITAKFNGYTFRFTKTTALSGTVTASSDILTVDGTWTVNSSYDRLSIGFTGPIPDFAFFNREWKFVSMNSALVELSAANGDNDVVHFQRE